MYSVARCRRNTQLNGFSRESGWNVLYSTQIPLNIERIKKFEIKPLEGHDATEYFAARWGAPLSDADNVIAQEIAVELLSGIPQSRYSINLVTNYT